MPFDYDKRFLALYQSMPDSELREDIARNKITFELESQIEEAFNNLHSFCFETNFHVFPKGWLDRAKSLGYCIDLYFFCLESIDLAKLRVEIRTKNHGHYVSDNVIDFKWKEGYKNINMYYSEFDYIMFIDNSNEESFTPVFEMIKKDENEFFINRFVQPLPEYTSRRLPNIFDLIDTAL